MATKRKKSAMRSIQGMLRKIRKPLPKQTGGAHISKIAYRRKQAKDILRKNIKSQNWD